MASGRFLKIEKGGAHRQGGLHVPLSFIKSHLFLLSVIGLIMTAGCGTIGSVEDEPLPEAPEPGAETRELSEEFINTLNETRSKLNDAFAAQNEVPEYFLQRTRPDRRIGDPLSGYRVQILSTRNVSEADSVANTFRSWSDRSIIGYFPQTYITFDQPYFKVHVGNFQFFDRASNFTQLLKVEFPGAWVVHDRIEPDAVPTGQIRLNEN